MGAPEDPKGIRVNETGHVCVICAYYGRETKLKVGHCCTPCTERLRADVRLVLDLAGMASVEPTTSGVGSSGVYGSRPPINVSGIDPENTLIGPAPSPTVLDVLESWVRMVREDRHMTPYGPWSHLEGSKLQDGGSTTNATFRACTAFLAAETDWIATTPHFPLEDYRVELTSCVRALKRWDPDARSRGMMVPCPTLTDDDTCGARLHYEDLSEIVKCRRCGVARDAATLAAIAMSDGREVWLDPEAAANWLGINERRLRRMAQRGEITRAHGRYLIRHNAGALDGTRPVRNNVISPA